MLRERAAMKNNILSRTVILAFLGLLAATVIAANKPITITMKDGSGKGVGTAVISDEPAGKGVKIALDLKNLPPGEHAVHLHMTAKCEGPGFTTAGEHFNPSNAHHGVNNPESPKPHVGDLPNFNVGPDGTAKMTLENPRVSLGKGSNSVFANGGTALVVHAKPDDLRSDPAGNAGDRIACGTISK